MRKYSHSNLDCPKAKEDKSSKMCVHLNMTAWKNVHSKITAQYHLPKIKNFYFHIHKSWIQACFIHCTVPLDTQELKEVLLCTLHVSDLLTHLRHWFLSRLLYSSEATLKLVFRWECLHNAACCRWVCNQDNYTFCFTHAWHLLYTALAYERREHQ